MEDKRGAYRFMVGRPEGKRPLERLGIEGRTIIKLIFRKWDGETWTGLAQETDMWRVFVNGVMNLRVP